MTHRLAAQKDEPRFAHDAATAYLGDRHSPMAALRTAAPGLLPKRLLGHHRRHNCGGRGPCANLHPPPAAQQAVARAVAALLSCIICVHMPSPHSGDES